jgi:hypothetical protein
MKKVSTTSIKIPKMPERGFYYHYKHDPEGSEQNYAYQVIAVGHHTESDCREEDQFVVIYRPLYESAFVYEIGKLYDIRPLKMFMEEVTLSGVKRPRFQKITDPELIVRLKKVQSEMYPN